MFKFVHIRMWNVWKMNIRIVVWVIWIHMTSIWAVIIALKIIVCIPKLTDCDKMARTRLDAGRLKRRSSWHCLHPLSSSKKIQVSSNDSKSQEDFSLQEAASASKRLQTTLRSSEWLRAATRSYKSYSFLLPDALEACSVSLSESLFGLFRGLLEGPFRSHLRSPLTEDLKG